MDPPLRGFQRSAEKKKNPLPVLEQFKQKPAKSEKPLNSAVKACDRDSISPFKLVFERKHTAEIGGTCLKMGGGKEKRMGVGEKKVLGSE